MRRRASARSRGPNRQAAAPRRRFTAREEELEALAERLRVREDEHPAYSLLAELLFWHRREEKPEWWAYFHRIGYESDDDFTDDRECIGGLELIGKVRDEKRSTVYEYEFEPQDHKFSVGSEPFDPATGKKAGDIVAIDDALGRLELKRGPGLVDVPHPRALIPGTPVPTGVLRDAVADVAEWVADHGLDTPGPHRAIRDLLLRRPPASLTPDNGSYLAVQGPPGSGKTWTGARMITDLVRAGKRVGITAHSHAAIGKLLDETVARAREEKVKLRAIQKADDHQRCTAKAVSSSPRTTPRSPRRCSRTRSTSPPAPLGSGRDPRCGNSVDVLFVDEASQKSLADIVAVSGAATSIVLLGDPQQLAQPSKGSHPEGVAVSALEYLLDGDETMPEGLGLFLETTHRMHPKVCAFISEVAYDGGSTPSPASSNSPSTAAPASCGSPSSTAATALRRPKKPCVCRELFDDLIGTKWTDKHGVDQQADA